tara:strand:- start:3043 stop:3267 length:225 start_codon:yes stop_codon:yes gene_type:complete
MLENDIKKLTFMVYDYDKIIMEKLKEFIEFYNNTSKLNKNSKKNFINNKIKLNNMYNELKQYYAIINIIKNEIE